jgi:prepilin-type N-terminal cleavage/methylation domain-containing protein
MNRLMYGHSRRQSTSAESGYTVIELMVALLIFSIFLAIVTTSILALTRAATKIQVAAVSTNQELAVFSRLDHAIRYSDGINAQGTGSSGDSYIEFRTPSDSTPSGQTMCTQWRYDPTAATIASRQWQDGSFSTATPWDVQIRNVANDGGANYPFQFQAATPPNQVLEEMVLTIDAGNTVVKGAAISSTYVARNSRPTSASPSGPGPVCPATGSRL